MPAGVWTWLGLVGVEAATSSVALTEARQCMLLGGSLDLFRSGTEHAPRCIWQPCPVGAEKAEGSCVAPRRTGQALEHAFKAFVIVRFYDFEVVPLVKWT